MKACGGCKKLYYCTVQCQRLDWRSGHKEDCQGKKKKTG